ncbi:hypothetical protein [Streptomyces boluensis]|uniref:DoxX family protein n=1 Tax=Streptomyces boluensis TaxID=1775135 RepID=A0A964V0Q9_9ACTN|nr:hypothetical protein [Streptomyces boluensis]NBE56447.1 hypothetical protein [Streptomyces boluensis]
MDSMAAVGLAVFFLAVGVAHFVFPRYFRSLVPGWLGRARLLVKVSGVAELVVGALVWVPASRAAGAWAAAGLVTVYLVPHLDALRPAHRGRDGVLWQPVGVAARLVVNLCYLGLAVAVALSAARP